MRLLTAAIALFLLALAACSPAEPPTRCTPNTTIPCTCPGGSTSSQTCSSDGAGYSVCACGAADAGDVVALDGAASVDAAMVPDVAGDLVEVRIWVDPPRDASDVVDVGLEDRPDVQPDRAAPLDAPDGMTAPDVVDVVQPADARVNCNTGMKLPCRSNEECLTSCAPHHLGYLWCCTAGGECRPQSRGMTCLPR